MSKNIKRVIIATVFIAILFVAGLALQSLLRPNPTCSDGIKNQMEEGVDCGGPCPPCEREFNLEEIEVAEKEWAHTRADKFDVAIKVRNPNNAFGATSFRYKGIFKAEGGQTIKESGWQEGFILPQETKHVLIQDINLPQEPHEVTVEIRDPIWKQFKDYRTPRLPATGTRFEKNSEGVSRVKGTLINKSDVDFEEIKVKSLLRDEKGDLLATNYQIMNTVRAGERRDYIMVFPNSHYLSEVSRVEIETETNVFDSENYIRIYGDPRDPEGL
ncbi:MAG: hypothetical protein U5L10_04810 [Candidatus Moranbacteria bacterium]|nr:hypothetical protein [Candidatus Moranbacteria bacterium]